MIVFAGIGTRILRFWRNSNGSKKKWSLLMKAGSFQWGRFYLIETLDAFGGLCHSYPPNVGPHLRLYPDTLFFRAHSIICPEPICACSPQL
jgi:hypothetical protein